MFRHVRFVSRGLREKSEANAAERDQRVIAGMNVNVWDVNDHVQALIRSRRPVKVGALTDPGTPLDSLHSEPIDGSD